MAKTIITLGREYCTGGRYIAEDVANALGIKLYDKELITMAAKNSGLSEEAVAASEKRHTHSLLYSLYTMGNELPLGDQVFILQSRIIKQLAEEGPCVILGRCGDYVLRERKDVLRVFVYAPKEWRLQYAKTNPLVKAKDEKGIKDEVEKTDRNRSAYYNYYTQNRWGDAHNYDLAINAALGRETCVKMIRQGEIVKTNQSQTAPAEVRENIMGTMEINPLLLKLSIPMMISMLVQALYNVVDSVFVSHVSESALTAVSLAFSLQNVMIAVGVGTGVGVNALLSKSLGEKNQGRANATAENGIFLSLCSFAVFFVIGLTCMKPYFYAQTSDAVIAQQGIRYLSVCCIFSLGLFTQTMGEKLLAATGRTHLSMISQLVGAVVNIILDPIFIFGYCGQALSGTTGAAVATVIGQFCGAGMTLFFNLNKNPDIQISFKGFRPSAKAIGRIYTVGLPSIAMQCVGSLMTFGMNLILMAFSATAVAVFGVYFKLQSFVFMPIFGLNNGMVPIISYNYGARRPDRVKKTIKLSVCYAEGIMLAGFCIFQFAPGLVLSIFAASDAMLAIGIPAMRIICLHFLLAGVSIVLSSVFQALGNGVFSLIVSVCRQLFVLLPAAWLLAQTGSVNNVWWAFLIAEVVSILMSLAFYARINKTTIAPLYH